MTDTASFNQVTVLKTPIIHDSLINHSVCIMVNNVVIISHLTYWLLMNRIWRGKKPSSLVEEFSCFVDAPSLTSSSKTRLWSRQARNVQVKQTVRVLCERSRPVSANVSSLSRAGWHLANQTFTRWQLNNILHPSSHTPPQSCKCDRVQIIHCGTRLRCSSVCVMLCPFYAILKHAAVRTMLAAPNRSPLPPSDHHLRPQHAVACQPRMMKDTP